MRDLSAERWLQIEALLDAVLDRDPGERAAYLNEACRDDPALRQEVEALLEAGEAAPAFLEGQALDLALPFLPDLLAEWDAVAPMENQHIGPYRLLSVAGRGGMGVVYRAERAGGPFEREVAIKLLPPGKETEAVLRRFEHEQQVLASLNQPHIARLYDGGLTEDGRPYFVMEYVDGQPIDRYCDTHRLPIEARLRLFQTVAEAVHYAHRNLVVHRDLKPSNLLVTDDGTAKLLDFGIAKPLTGDERAASALTRTGERWMTPEYAAPEQVRGEPVTTATDVYQLGVVLYELLTGRRPYRVGRDSLYEVERAICEEEPTRPSVAVAQPVALMQGGTPTKVTPESVSRARNTRVDQLQRKLSGDLDAIVLKALRKEPEARYASAEAFVEDVKRYLAAQPVEARRGSASYRASKIVRRHQWGVAAAAVIVLLLIGYAITVTVQAERVRVEAEKAERVSTFLVDLFELSDPYVATGDTISARELLDRSARQIEIALEDQPEVKAELMTVLGQVYQHLGLYEESRALLETALDMRRALFAPPHVALATSLNKLAKTLMEQGKHEAARSFYAEALAMVRDLPGTEELEAEVLNNFAVLHRYEGRYEKAEALYQEALTVQHRLTEEDHPNVATTQHNLGVVLKYQDKFAAAESLLSDALAMRQRLYGEEHWHVAVSLNALASVRTDLELYEAADSMHRRALAVQEKVLGEDHPHVASTLNDLGLLLHREGAFDAAEPLLRRALSIRRNAYGEEHGYVAVAYYNLGALLQDKGRYEEAERSYRQVLEIDRKVFGDDHPEVGKDLAMLALLVHDRGEWAEADSLYRQAIALQRAALPVPLSLSTALLGRGQVLIDQGRLSEAEPLLQQALAIRQQAFPEGHGETAEVKSVLGICLTRLKRYPEAEQLLLEGFAGLEPRSKRDRYRRKTLKALVLLYEAWGKPSDAAHYLQLLGEEV